jgi:2-polyprenyl-6-hydroxyphenyl methylase/3-demethylubiquinone-9 3-methyltransferase
MAFEVVPTVETLPFPDQSFDGVLCLSVLEYVDDPERCLSEFTRIIKPGGVLLVSVPNRFSLLRMVFHITLAVSSLWRKPWPLWLRYSRHAFTARAFTRLLRARGLQAGRVQSFGGPLQRVFPRLPLHSLFFISARRIASQDVVASPEPASFSASKVL